MGVTFLLVRKMVSHRAVVSVVRVPVSVVRVPVSVVRVSAGLSL